MCDFLVVVDYFRFAGAEGNEPFEENLISCACHAPFVDRLRYLWRMEQLRKLTRGAAKDCDVTQILQLLARESRLAFIPPEQEEALQNIPGKTRLVSDCKMSSAKSRVELLPHHSCARTLSILTFY